MKKIRIALIAAALLLLPTVLLACSSNKSTCTDGHTFGEATVVEEATCMSGGVTKRVCLDCGYPETESTAQVDHNYVDNACSMCGRCIDSNMTFELNADGASYKLTKYTDSSATEVTVFASFNGKPVTVIGVGAFRDLRELKSVELPSSITELERAAFSHCKSLEEINLPEGLKVIGDSAFIYCESIKSLELPSTVETIGGGAFTSCISLEDIKLPEKLSSIGDGAFSSCKKIENVTIPTGVTELADRVFSDCDALKTVTMLGEITVIGEGAVGGCNSLERFSAKGTPEIKANAFAESSIYMLDIPDGVSYVGKEAFAGCRSLHSITLAESLTEIGENAFRGCIRLKLIRNRSSLTLDATTNNPGGIASNAIVLLDKDYYNIEYIDGFAFFTSYLTMPDTGEKHKTFRLIDYVGHDRTPEFPVLASCDEYVLKDYIIAKYAFYEENILFADLPEGVTRINEWAFFNCERLLRISVPSSAIEVDTDMYVGAESLMELINNSSYYEPWQHEQANDPFRYVQYDHRDIEDITNIREIDGFLMLNVGSRRYVLAYLGDSDTLNIPELPSELSHYEYIIHDHAFENQSFKDVVIPNGITRIEEEAFAGSTFGDLVIPDSVEYIGFRAFAGATFGDLVIPDSVEIIKTGAFYNAKYDSITLPEGAEIGNIIHHYSIDEEIYDTDGMYYFGNIIVEARSDLSGAVVINSGAVQLVDALFSGNTNITSVVIPEGVKYIGSNLFNGCTALKTVTIPKSAIRLGVCILPDQETFEKVIYQGTQAEWQALTEGVRLGDLYEYTVECTDGTLTVQAL